MFDVSERTLRENDRSPAIGFQRAAEDPQSMRNSRGVRRDWDIPPYLGEEV